MAAKGSSPMSETRCMSLNKLLPDLEAKLILDHIRSHLHIDAGGFLTEVEIIEVFSDRSRVENVRSLFSVLKTKDNAAFGSFCLVLSNSGYAHWSKTLMDQAGLDHDFKATPQLETAKVDAILCKRKKMFKLTFKDIQGGFSKCHDQLLSILKQLPPEDFKMFVIRFNDSLRGIRKNVRFEQSDMESPLDVLLALSLQHMYTQFDLEVFDVMAECLSEDTSKKFAEALNTYKENILRPLLEKTLSELAGDAEVVSAHDNQKKKLSLAFVVPDDATFGTLMRARKYLEEEMEIHDVSNLRFDFNCITVLFDIACPPSDVGEVAKRFLSDKHLQEMKKLNIIEVFLLSHWAVVVADGSICYFDEGVQLRMSEPTNKPIARHGTNILELVTQVADDLMQGDCAARITDQQLVALQKGIDTVIKQCQEREGRLKLIEEEKLQKQIGAIESSMQNVKATVRNLEEKRSRDKAVLQDHERDLNNAKNRLDEARKSKDRAVSGTIAAVVGTFILGAMFPPSLAVTVPATAAMGTRAILNAQSDIDRINGNIGRIRSDISSTEREIRSRNDKIRQHEADILRLRSSCDKLMKKRGYLRESISFLLQAKMYFTELINATEMGGQRTMLLQSSITKFHARQDFPISTSRGVYTVAKSFYEAWKSFEDQVLSREEYLSVEFSDVQ